MLLVRNADCVSASRRVASGAGPSSSRSSSCRSSFRLRSPGSGCSPRSGAWACSPRRSPFTQTAVTLAVAFVSGPLYVRAAIAAFEAVDPNLVDGRAHAGRLARANVLSRRVAARSRRARRGRGARVRARSRRVRRDDHVRGLAATSDPDPAACDLRRVRSDFDVTLAISGLLVLISAAILVTLKLVNWLDRSQLNVPPSASRLRPRRSAHRRSGDGCARRAVGAGKSYDPAARSPASPVRRPGASRSATRHGSTRLGHRRSRRTTAFVGFVFQDYALFPHLTVRQNVAFGGRGSSTAARALRHLASGRGAPRRPLRRRAATRCACSCDRSRPGVLLLDEPLSALDPHTRGHGSRRAPRDAARARTSRRSS